LEISLDECCHSALSEKNILYRRESPGNFVAAADVVGSLVALIGVGLSATNKEYVGSGGRKARKIEINIFNLISLEIFTEFSSDT
jgi:hypothetical protein